jgi:hypothetical protein
MSALGHKQTSRDVRVTSALPPIADIRRMSWHDRFVPEVDITENPRGLAAVAKGPVRLDRDQNKRAHSGLLKGK